LMSFKNKKYTIIKKAVSSELALFLYNYIIVKKQCFKTMSADKYMSPFETGFGEWGDHQVPNTFVSYADVPMETLMLKLQPLMEKATGLKLYPNYSFLRSYKTGDILKRHKDRFSCEISTTLYLGGDPWPIYLEPSGKDGMKGKKINLKVGDMLIYKGEDLEHWREPFEGKEDCVQVFFHYNNARRKGAKNNMFDKRPHVGLPFWFKNKNNR
ncbi:unnamed protein product, partial [marine sediment metagenome]